MFGFAKLIPAANFRSEKEIMLDKKLLYVTIFSLSWALNIFFGKLALNTGIRPIAFTIQSTFIAAILLTIYIVLTRRKELGKINTGVLRNLIFIGILVGAAYVAGTYGLKLSTSVNYSFLIKSTLVFTILLAAIFLREKIDKGKFLLMFTFIAGAYFITTGGTVIVPKVGDLLTFFTAFCFSSALIIQKPLTKKISPDVIGWGRVLFALVVVLLLAPFMKANIFEFTAPKFVVLVGVTSSILAVYINKTISVSSASYFTMMSMIVPVISSLLGILFLNETMNIFQVVGGILIILSGVFVQKLKI